MSGKLEHIGTVSVHLTFAHKVCQVLKILQKNHAFCCLQVQCANDLTALTLSVPDKKLPLVVTAVSRSMSFLDRVMTRSILR